MDPSADKSSVAAGNLSAKLDGLVIAFLRGCASLAYHYSWWVVSVALILSVICVVYTQQKLYFDPDQASLIRRSASLQSNQDKYIAEFPHAEDMVVVVEEGTISQRKLFIDALEKRLQAEPEIFDFVFGKIELGFIKHYALQYLDAEDIKDVSEVLNDNLPLFKALAGSGNLAELFTAIHSDTTKTAKSPQEFGQVLPAINNFVTMLNTSMETRGRFKYHSPWMDALSEMTGSDAGEMQEMSELMLSTDLGPQYNTLANGRLYLLLARPKYRDNESHDITIERAVTRLRQIISELERSHTAVLVSLTGENVLDVDQAQASTEDSYNSAVLSLFLVTLVFIWAFREWFRPVMAVCTLMVGVSWTMGFTTLVVGHLNLLTVTFATILIGLGIDFGIHFIYRYDEERTAGKASLSAMQATLAGAGRENLTGALSTAIAFWVLNLTDFVGIGELGTIAGTGIMLCYLAMATVLPAALFIRERHSKTQQIVGFEHYRFIANFEQAYLRRPGLVLIICTIFSLWCAWQATKVKYDYNLLNLQATGLESVRTEMHLQNCSSHSLLCGISLAKDPETAARLMKAYEALPNVAAVESVAAIIPANYQAKRDALYDIAFAAKRLPTPHQEGMGQSPAAMLRSMGSSFESINAELGPLMQQLKSSPDPKIRANALLFEKKLNNLFETLQSMGPGPIQDGLTAFEKAFFNDFHSVINFLKMQRPAPPLELRDLPANLYSREVGLKGSIQVRVFPKENVWERPAQERFVKALQKVDPHVVGMPVVAYYDVQELRHSNEQAGVYALVAIWVLLFLHFRRVGVALLALTPKVVGILWMVGLMGYLHTDFNSANFLSLPLILGIGLVFGVHVVHRVAEEGSSGVFGHSTGPSILLAAITTMAGFGTMVAAQHQGIASLGIIMTCGVGANLLSSLLLLPAMIAYLRRFGYEIKFND